MNPHSYRIFAVSFILAAVAAAACVLLNRNALATRPTPLPTRVSASARGLSALPADLVPALARMLARQSPQTWNAKPVGREALVFHNRVQHFSASFSSRGAQVQLGGSRHGQLGMQLLAVHSGNVSYPVVAGPPSPEGARIDIIRGRGLTEWYLNSPLGLEQGFTLAKPLAGGGLFALVFRLQGSLTPTLNGKVLEFYGAQRQSLLRYGNLLAYDARHRALPASMKLNGRTLQLAVNTRGARYPVTIDPLFSVITTLNDPLAAADDLFAQSVAISSDGTTALIGAPGVTVSGQTFAGVAYVFTRINGIWSSKPAAAFADPGAATNDEFGYSVALSGDGSTAVIAAPGTSISGNAGAGKAYLYTRTNGIWSGTPTVVFSDPTGLGGDEFGFSTALSADGQTALIGAPYSAVTGNTNAGDAYLYQQQNETWPSAPTATFGDPAGATKDYFGEGVALRADGLTALIGAPGTAVSGHASAGMAYLYEPVNGNWSNTPTTAFADPQNSTFDDFGYSPALSGDGSTALIGAYDTTVAGVSGAGAAYAYAQTNGAWSTTPTATFTDPAAGAHDYFGYTTALSANGEAAVIGAPNTSVSGNTFVGAAYGYAQHSGTWSTSPANTFASQAGASGSFGGSLALSADGTAALIGASEATISGANNVGLAYLFASPTDLSLALSSSPASVTTGQSVTYMLTVANNDTQVTASNVTLTDTLPSGMTFVSASTAGGACNNANGTVTCTLASLAPQATWQPSITVSASTAGSISDSASVTANQPDPNTANNTASVTTTVNANTGGGSGSGSSGGGGALGTLALLFLSGFWSARNMLRLRNKSRSMASGTF